MFEEEHRVNKVLTNFNERVKELNCIYQVDELLNDLTQTKDCVFEKLLKVLPKGWQYPTICEIKIIFGNREYKSAEYVTTEWVQSANIVVGDKVEGRIEVAYNQFIRLINGSQFLPDEQKLLNAVAARLGLFIYVRRLIKRNKQLVSVK